MSPTPQENRGPSDATIMLRESAHARLSMVFDVLTCEHPDDKHSRVRITSHSLGASMNNHRLFLHSFSNFTMPERAYIDSMLGRQVFVGVQFGRSPLLLYTGDLVGVGQDHVGQRPSIALRFEIRSLIA